MVKRIGSAKGVAPLPALTLIQCGGEIDADVQSSTDPVEGSLHLVNDDHLRPRYATQAVALRRSSS